MRASRISIFISIFLGASLSSANMVPLQFQADKNNIQILPQRFEYNLDDENHIKIGDIIIDSSTFGFQVAQSRTSNTKYRARFIWPAGLLKEGVLTIKDNTGKAIWSMDVHRKNTRLISAPQSPQSPLLRTQLSEFVTDQLSTELIEDMKFFPFMSFCINRTTKDTNIYLCSKELYLANQQGKLGIRSRSQGKRTSFVEINGKSVGNQGIIFMNDESENIGFRAMTPSGVILEVETRMKSVDFKDVVLSEDKKSLVLTASGAEPVNEESVKRISEEEWQFQVDAQRPILYLKGEGGIPMRQEFYIKGPIPSENIRPYLEKNAFSRVYKSQLSLQGHAAEGTSVSPGSKGQKVEESGKSLFRWTLDGIPTGQTSRHYLRVNEDKNSFLAAYNIYRDYAFEAGATGSYWLPAGQLYGGVFLNWWIENFLGLASSDFRLHWGLRLEESLVLMKKSTEANLTVTHLELLWRAKSGFHFVDKTWGLILPIEWIQSTGLSATSFGLGVFYSAPAPKNWNPWLHWYDSKFMYLTGASGGSPKLQSALQLNTLGYYHVNPKLSWNYGLGLNQYSFDPGDSKLQFQLLGGASYRF